MEYRREIDGLRALAVVPVVLFHAGLRNFGGGFVGVDVFFVISGYLITSIIVSELQAGTFTLTGFYLRRARRILPALLVVLVACLPLAWLLLVPSDMRKFSQSLFAISVFASNIYFWLKTEYFETSALLTPLLHTWSLSVEEQVYVLYPVALLFAWRHGRRWTAGMVVAVAIGSFALAQWGSAAHPVASFYLLPTRGWELLIGALAALYLSRAKTADGAPEPGAKLRGAASLAGLLAIAFAVLTYDRNTPFPGVYALAPVIGTALIILYARAGTLVGRLLGSRLLVGVGLISYGTYLWHYPLFAFARLQNSEEPSGDVFLALGIASMALAYLSWKYVELPFRDRQRTSRKQVVSLGLALSAIVGAFGLGGHFTAGYPNRLSAEQQAVAAFVEYDRVPVYRDETCFLLAAQTFRDFSADCGAVRDSARSILVWGDSFAAALSAGFRYLGPNVIQYTASACPPVMDFESSERSHCRQINEFVLREVARTRPGIVVLHAKWPFYNAREVSVSGLARTITEIRRVSAETRIFMVGSVPLWPKALPEVMLQNGITLHGDAFIRAPMLKDLEARDAGLRQIAAAGGIEFLSPLGHLCAHGACQAVAGFEGRFQPTAWDIGHLTQGGAALLAGKLLLQMKAGQAESAK